jgi:tetratricopeptide (TPR) repeat protein
MDPPSPAVPPAVAGLERRLQWRAAGVFMFVGILAALAVLSVVAALTPVRSVAGLPRDPAVGLARDAVHGVVPVAAGDLRFESALFGGAPVAPLDSAGRPRDPGRLQAALARADSLLEAARLRDLPDSRIPALQGHLALARGRYEVAERLYRHAIDLAAHTSEARLGLGVALALQARHTGDARAAQALTLRAIAQFAAVRRDAPVYAAALHDRALLLARAGRPREARAHAREYLALDSTSAWAERLRAETAPR